MLNDYTPIKNNLMGNYRLNTQTVPRESVKPPLGFPSGKPSAASSSVVEPQSLTNSRKA